MQGEAIVALVDELATRSGESLVTPDGQRRYGKHSFRSTGAVYLSSLGIELLKIQMLARWASPIITHYTRLAPLRSITNDFKRAILNTATQKVSKGKAIKDDANKSNTKGSDTKKVLKILKAELKKYEEEIAELNRRVKRTRHKLGPRTYVTNTKTQVVHRIGTTIEEAGLHACTLCGWRCAAKGRLSVDAPTVLKKTCDTCLPALRASLPKLG